MLDEPRDLGASRALVTGASGFIGGHLCRLLGASGVEVHGVSRRDRVGGEGVCRWWRADLATPGEAGRLLERIGPDVVFHLASHVFGSRDLSRVLPTFHDNLATTVYLLTAAAELGDCRIVVAGSMDEPRDGEGSFPSSPYAAAKIAAGTYARMFHDLYHLPITVARIFMVYGPDQKDEKKLVPYVVRSLLAGESPRLSGGTREVDWVYVEDVARALAELAWREDLAGRTLDVGTGVRSSVSTVVEILEELVGGDARAIFGAVDERPRETEPVADVEGTWELARWRSEVELRDGLERTVAWYRSS
jgi:nucleoside-diphosphate-sugar epimerase